MSAPQVPQQPLMVIRATGCGVQQPQDSQGHNVGPCILKLTNGIMEAALPLGDDEIRELISHLRAALKQRGSAEQQLHIAHTIPNGHH